MRITTLPLPVSATEQKLSVTLEFSELSLKANYQQHSIVKIILGVFL